MLSVEEKELRNSLSMQTADMFTVASAALAARRIHTSDINEWNVQSAFDMRMALKAELREER